MASTLDNAKRNTGAVLVLAGAILAAVSVPHELLRPISVGVAVVAFSSLFGIRAYLRRLEAVAGFLATNKEVNQADTLAALLSEPERRFLRVGGAPDAAATIGQLRARQRAIERFGVWLGMLGLCAGLVAIVVLDRC